MSFISLTRVFFWSRLSSAERYRRRTENIFMALTKNTQHKFCIKLCYSTFVLGFSLAIEIVYFLMA